MSRSDNTKGRQANAAQPLGERTGTSSKPATKRTGKSETETAGPDGGDSGVVGETFKGK